MGCGNGVDGGVAGGASRVTTGPPPGTRPKRRELSAAAGAGMAGGASTAAGFFARVARTGFGAGVGSLNGNFAVTAFLAAAFFAAVFLTTAFLATGASSALPLFAAALRVARLRTGGGLSPERSGEEGGRGSCLCLLLIRKSIGKGWGSALLGTRTGQEIHRTSRTGH